MPTRLLELGSDAERSNARLIIPEGRGLNCPYVALSYRWGGPIDFKLTNSNIDQLNAIITVQDLPKTVQDAIHVATRLRYRYLWADSLCILQDSTDD